MTAIAMAAVGCGSGSFREARSATTGAGIDPVTLDCSQNPDGSNSCNWLSQDGACQAVADYLGISGTFYEYKFDNDPRGTKTGSVGGYTFTINVTGDSTFSWTSNGGVDFVISKGSSAANIYVYDPEATSDTGLVTPTNASGSNAGLSHATFCFDWNVLLDGGPQGSFDRSWTWTISKVGKHNGEVVGSADGSAPPVGPLAGGEQYEVDYTVDVTPQYVDNNYAVQASVTITNPAPFAATIQSVSAVLGSNDLGLVGCTIDGNAVTLPSSLDSSASMTCTFSHDFGDTQPADGNVVFTVTTSGDVGGGQLEKAFAMPTDPANETDECVTVTDPMAGQVLPQTVCKNSQEFSYPTSISAACGNTGTQANTASFTTNDTGATGSASWDVDWNTAVCVQGCTLTQGYWKTHSLHGPAPYDDAWLNIGPNGADTTFYLSGKSYYEVLRTPVQGSAYYSLAHQFIAAKLNALNGADSSAVSDILKWCNDTFFATYTPSSKLSNTLKSTALNYATALDSYNTGTTGPGHCSE